MKYVRTIRIIGIICLVIGLSAVFVRAQDMTFDATVDKTQMSSEDVLRLSFRLAGGNIDLNVTPELPDLAQDFDILGGPSRSTEVSIVNGKPSSSLAIHYVLSPKTTGALRIGAATLTYDNKTYTTEPITIEVVKGSPPSQRQDQTETASVPEVFIRAVMDKETVYIGEQLTISYLLYTQVSISGYTIRQQPNFTGFWVEDLQIPDPPKLQYQDIDGQQYGVALMKKFALFPTSSGEVTIDPMVMTFSVTVQNRPRTRSRDPFDRFFNDPFDSFRAQEIIRKTQPLTFTILPLPEENRPETFHGDVGNFTMSVDVDQQEVKQDEPITLRVRIQGSGNIKTVKEPVITLPEFFKRYDTQITENPFTLQEPVQGEKIFETVIIPSSDGKYQIGPVQFSYFDPQRQTYQTIRSEPIRLLILPQAEQEAPMERRIATKEEIKLLGQDLRFIKTDLPRLKDQGQYWYQRGLYQVLHLLPLVAIFLAWGYKHYRAKYMSDERYLRQKRANKVSKKRLKRANELMQRGESKEFYAEISGMLCQYLGDKLNMPPAGIGGEEISRMLHTRGLDDETSHLVKRCLDECDFARFAPVEATRDEMRSIFRHVETIIRRIERLKGLRANSRTEQIARFIVVMLIPILSLLFPVLGECAELSVEELFRQGNTLYEEGKYRRAIDAYQQILASGVRNGYVYYNLGNALLKDQRIGEAILNFERAKRLLPRDEDVVFNLDYAKALTLDKIEQDPGRIRRTLRALRDYFTPNEIGIFFWIGYLGLVALIMIFMFVPHRWKLLIVYLSLLPALLLLCSAVVLFFQMSYASADQAILLIPETEAKTGPGEGYSAVFEIHEGAKVQIQREKLEWVEIKLPNNVIGWVKTQDLERIEPTS